MGFQPVSPQSSCAFAAADQSSFAAWIRAVASCCRKMSGTHSYIHPECSQNDHSQEQSLWHPSPIWGCFRSGDVFDLYQNFAVLCMRGLRCFAVDFVGDGSCVVQARNSNSMIVLLRNWFPIYITRSDQNRRMKEL